MSQVLLLSACSASRGLSRRISPCRPVKSLQCLQKIVHNHQRRCMSMEQLDEDKGSRERIVILGSGWAGYPMMKKLDHRKFQVVIVSPRSYFVFTPLLASTSVGTLEFRTALEPLRSHRNKAVYMQARANDVDFYRKTVTLEECVTDPKQGLAPVDSRFQGRSEEEIRDMAVQKSKRGQLFDLGYDKLVIGVGSYSQTFNTPGVKEHANFLKDVGDARKIRTRIAECFETASLPTTSETVRKQLLHFAVVGGGPTGIEFSAELHDIIKQDMSRLYPELADIAKVTVLDVAPQILSMFDDKLGAYAMQTFGREGIEIKTSRNITSLEHGLPGVPHELSDLRPGLTLHVKQDGAIGVGMVVWSTGLMSNPFIARALSSVRRFPPREVIFKPTQHSSLEAAERTQWTIRRHEKSGALMTNDRLRVILTTEHETGPDGLLLRAFMRDVFAIGDCAAVQDTGYPATAQVANQKGEWLAKRLNAGDLHTTRFVWKNMGIMAYIGGSRAIVEGGHGGNISGRAAWVLWRSAYLFMALSWRNRILIPVYWAVNFVFGRDISRF